MSGLITAVYGGSCDACLKFDRATSVRNSTSATLSLNLPHFPLLRSRRFTSVICCCELTHLVSVYISNQGTAEQSALGIVWEKMQAQVNNKEKNHYGAPFMFCCSVQMCIFRWSPSRRFVCSRVSKFPDLRRGLELGQKKHWSMKLTTSPPWSNVTIMIVLLGTKLPSGCTIHSSPMLSPHATSSFHLLACCPFLLTRKQ